MACDDKDLIKQVGTLPDGRPLLSRHRPDHSTGLYTARQAPAGTAMHEGEELITTRDHEGAPGEYEIVDSYVHRPTASGPAQVATAGYRSGWERTFNSPGGSA